MKYLKQQRAFSNGTCVPGRDENRQKKILNRKKGEREKKRHRKRF